MIASDLTVTFFFDYTAAKKREERLTLQALAERIEKTTQRAKANLPWLKLARFGDAKTDKGSLRNDGNMLAITGIEADYDGEQISLEDAEERLIKAGIAAILYTSPSHKPGKPRWRVLCPLSKEHAPDRRTAIMGRLNGLFGGIFADESWTLSQAYYFGSVNNNHTHRVAVIDGIPIDQADELDKVWIGKNDTKLTLNGETNGTKFDPAALLQAIREGKSYHRPMVRLLGHYARSGTSMLIARGLLIDAMDSVFPLDRDARWQDRMTDLDRCIADIYGKNAETRWQEGSFSPALGSPRPAAAVAGNAAEPEAVQPKAKARGTPHGRLLVLGMEHIDTAPPRSYLLKGLLSPGEISIWVGPPKCGKSFLLLYVAYMLSLRRSVFGRRVKPTKVLYVAAEGEAGIANRIRALRNKHGPSVNFHFIAQPADLLRDTGDKSGLIEAAQAVGANLIVPDTLSRLLAGGDENSPHDMGAFVRNVSEVRHDTGAHIAIVHHGTKASNGSNPRGHSSLTGADDALNEVLKQQDGSRVATVVHAKDDADGMRWSFSLETVELGTDDDGDPITTLLTVEAAEPRARPHTDSLSDNLQIGMQTLHAAMRAHATLATVGEDNAELSVVTEAQWRAWFYREGKPGESQDTKQKAFRRIVDKLQAKGLTGSRDGFVWPIGHKS